MIYDNPINTPNDEYSLNHPYEKTSTQKQTKWILSKSNSYTEQIHKYHNHNCNGIGEEREHNSNVSLKKTDVKAKLKKIFMSIAKYNSKDNSYYITQLTLNKVLKDSRIIAECSIRLSEVDLLYQKACSFDYKMNYEQFLDFLIRLSKKLFPEEFYENPKGTVDFFLLDFFDKYKDVLNSKSLRFEKITPLDPLNKIIASLIRYSPDSKQRVIIFKVYPTLTALYHQYIYSDMSYVDRVNTSKQVYMNKMKLFVRDFEVMPYMISEKFFVMYINMVMENNEQEEEEGSHVCKVVDETIDNGAYFSLDNFCMMMIHLSLLSYSKIASYEESNINEASKLILFLERMDNMKGMRQFINKIPQPAFNKYTLLLPNQTIIDLGEDIEKDITNCHRDINSQKENNIAIASSLNCSNRNMNESCDKKDKELPNNNEESISEIIKKHIVDLRRTFLFFCHKGDTLNINRMSFTCYIKFLKHCKLYKDKIQKGREKEKDEEKHYYTIDKDNDFITKDMPQLKKKTPTIDSLVENNKQLKLNDNNYKKSLNQISNLGTVSCRHQIGESEASIIFSLLTGPKHYETSSRQSTSSYTLLNSSTYNMCLTMNAFPLDDKSKSEGKMLRMSFDQFIQSFELIAHRMNPNDKSTHSLYTILTNNIISNLFKEDKKGKQLYNSAIESAIEKIKEKEIQSFLESLSDALCNLAVFYANNNTQISFESFLAFYKDFSLYPELVNLTQLKNMFFILSEKNNDDNQYLNEKIVIREEITYANLIDSIALTSMIYEFEEDYGDIGRMIYVVERMNQSEGVIKLKNRHKRAT